jgi:hypothetical protein
MIRLNIKTHNLVKVKSFRTLQDLFNYCRDELCWLVGSDYDTFLNDAEKLAKKIWDTNVGQSVKTDLGHTISIQSKVRTGKYLVI